MNRVVNLMEAIAASNVPFAPLGELLNYSQPGNYLVESTSYHNSFATPVLTAGQTFILGYTNETTGVYPASPGAPAIIFDDFTTAFKWVDFPFKAKSSAMKILTPKLGVSLRYVWFAMQTLLYSPEEHARQWIATYSRFRVPVPPLEMQREIIWVLDQFIDLESMISAELEARARQFQYYRDHVMTFDENTLRAPLGDVAEVRSGWGFPTADQGRTQGELPFYKVSDMNLVGNETVMSRANNYVSVDVARKLGAQPAPSGAIIFPKIGAAIATNKKRILSRPSAYDNNVMGLIPSNRISSQFLFYWLQTMDLSSLANDSGAVPSIRKSEVERMVVPLPSLDDQNRIAASLNYFDTLLHDRAYGLPAELSARRKQYRHYRDQLLAFREAH